MLIPTGRREDYRDKIISRMVMSGDKIIMKRYLILYFFLTLLNAGADAQQGGLPFIRNFRPQEYRTSPQNWAIVQDPRGVIYVGNNDGILVYAGSGWRLIKQQGVSALAIDSTGKVYVGLDNDIGFLQPEPTGLFQYHSLKERLPEESRSINQCYSVFSIPGRIIFQTSDKIYIYSNSSGNIKVLEIDEGLYWSFEANKNFYATIKGKGLYWLQNDSLVLAPGGELFARESVATMMPYKKNEILISTYHKGIFVYSTVDKPKLTKPAGFEKVDEFIYNNDACCGIKLYNGDYAVGTIQGGIIVFTIDGKIKNIYNKGNGLQDNSVYWLYSDQNQQIWAALDNGISLIQYNLPFTQYTETNGLNGGIMCLKMYNNKIYAGTSQYLYVQEQNGNFKPIEGTESQNFYLFTAHNTLLLANLSGVFEIKDDKAIPVNATSGTTISSVVSALSICMLPGKPDMLLIGATNGLFLLKYKGNSWYLEERIKGFTKPAYKLEMDESGNIWASTFLDLYRLRLNSDLDSIDSELLCTREIGLPSNYANAFKLASGKVVFCSERGVYNYINERNIFVPDPDFVMLNAKVTQFVQLNNQDILYEQILNNGNSEKGILKYENGKFRKYSTPFEKFKDIGGGDSPYNICEGPDGSILYGMSLGILRYDPSLEVSYDRPFNTLVRTVESGDSLLYGGEDFTYPYSSKSSGLELPYSLNNLMFHFSAAFYEDAEKNMFSYRLVGLDSNWSEWTHDSKTKYTNLSEGRYIFQVRSRNQYNITGSTASYSFSILPPWYRTGWAILLYFMVFILFLIVVMKLYTRRLAKQKVVLEKIVDERTAEVLDQKKKIQENNEELTRSNDKLNDYIKELNDTNEKLRNTLEIVNSQKEEIEGAHQQITDQNSELKRYRSHLEQLVEERTKELLLAKNKAEESDRLKTAFLQNMSHEIRTPMNGILGFLELLKEPDLDDANKSNYLDIINNSGQRLLNTINDIIELSRIESNQLSVHTTKFNVGEVLEYHLNFFRHQAEERNLSLTITSSLEERKLMLVSDRHILDNILTNLINNAIKFTIVGGVEFGHYLEANSVVFYVKDTGIGIPADRIEAIFDRFVQADMKNTRTHEGSGLGLAIVKGYLDLINGKIWVKSEIDKGSIFFISLPYHYNTEEIEERTEKKRANHSQLKDKMTILIAEDDQNGFLYLKSILKKLTQNIVHVKNGREAVELVRTNPDISLVLMDIKMPDMNGLDATMAIRKFNKSITIIAQSAYAFAEDKEMAIESGCNDYISKPINSKELLQVIARYTT